MVTHFWAQEGIQIPAITAEVMREVDRIAMEVFNLGILQMMENAGRNLAENARDMLGKSHGEIIILDGGGGNGGGGLCCARHLHNHGYPVKVVLDRSPEDLKDAAAIQWQILQRAGVQELPPSQIATTLSRANLVVDALIGYSLKGAPRGCSAELISQCNRKAALVLALDVPSGLNATTGESPGVMIRADRILTLALPKTGLDRTTGSIYLADIGIPPEVYQHLDLSIPAMFAQRYWIRLHESKP